MTTMTTVDMVQLATKSVSPLKAFLGMLMIAVAWGGLTRDPMVIGNIRFEIISPFLPALFLAAGGALMACSLCETILKSRNAFIRRSTLFVSGAIWWAYLALNGEPGAPHFMDALSVISLVGIAWVALDDAVRCRAIVLEVRRRAERDTQMRAKRADAAHRRHVGGLANRGGGDD